MSSQSSITAAGGYPVRPAALKVGHASSAYVCLRQSVCTPIRLQPKRAAKEPPHGDRQMGPLRMYRRLDTNKCETNKSPAASIRSPPAWKERLNQVIQSATAQPHHKDLQAVLCAPPFCDCLGSKTAQKQAPSSSAVCR